eukprot:2293571-Amphidinium_carterae.1
MAMRILLTIAILKNFTLFTTDMASAFLNTPIDNEVLVQPPKESYHNTPHILWRMTKALYGLRTSPKHWPEHLSTIPQQLGFTRLKSDTCVFVNKQSTIYIMAYVDDLLAVGEIATTQPFLQQFQQHLELKVETHMPNPLVICSTVLQQDSQSIQYGQVQPNNNPGNKKPPNCTQPLNVQDSCGTTPMGLTIASGHCICCERVEQGTTTT